MGQRATREVHDLPSSYEGNVLSWGPHPHDPITSQVGAWALTPSARHWELGIQHMNLGMVVWGWGTQHVGIVLPGTLKSI